MKGDGFYDHHAAPQAQAARLGARSVWRRALDQLNLDGDAPVTVADLGCAGGRGSAAVVAEAIAACQARPAAPPVVVYYIDRPENDWSALWRWLDSDPDSPCQAATPATALAVGRSFYGPVLPFSSVTLGWCSHAVHWLSRAPEDVGHRVFPQLAAPEQCAGWRRQAEEDWRCFLHHRAAELQPGAQLVVELAAASDDGSFGAEPLYRTLERARSAVATVDEKVSGRDSGHRSRVIPVYCRTAAELQAPFGDPALAELELLELSVHRWPDPYFEDYRRTGDARAYGEAWAATVRAFTEEVLFADRPDQAAACFGHFAALTAADPEAFTHQWCVADLRIRRRWESEPSNAGAVS